MVAYLTERIPEAEIVTDYQQNAMMSYLRALRLAGDDPVVLLEDDIVLTKDFQNKLLRAVQGREDVLCQFFSMRKKDLTIGSRMEPGSSFMMDQCIYVPGGMALRIFEFWKGWPRKAESPYGCDTMKAAFLKANKLRYYIHVPSLVDHRISKSMIDPRRSSKRQSYTFTDPWL